MESRPDTAPAPPRRQNLPDFRLSVAGRDFSPADTGTVEILGVSIPLVDITGTVRPRLISLGLTEKRGEEADELSLLLEDGDGRLAIPEKGATITLALGWKQVSGQAGTVRGLIDKGSFTVDETEWSGPPDRIRIKARSADLTAGFRVRKEKAYHKTTLGAVAREIAAANGYRARVAPALAAIAIPVLAQDQASDMATLRRLGREHDAVATIKGQTLILSPIGAATTASGKPLPGLTLSPADGDRYRFRRIDRGADAGVTARWHDPREARRKSVTVGGGGGDGGAKPKVLRKIYHSEAAARRAANAELGRTKRGGAEFEMELALGRPDIYPECPAALTGFKPQADALQWILAEVEHRLGRDGLRSRLKLETKGASS